jgi:hypothetical protein
VASSQGSVTVSPGIPAYATERFKQLGLLSRSVYVGVLLHNYQHGPFVPLPVVGSPARVVKVRMQLSIPRFQRVAVTKLAARWKMSLSELVESLIIYDADNEEETLTILPVRGTGKPLLKIHK